MTAPEPKPPTRVTVSSGPKATPHLHQAPLMHVKPTPEYYRMQAHRERSGPGVLGWVVIGIAFWVALGLLVFWLWPG